MRKIQDARILIVDDSRELQSLLKDELYGAGYYQLWTADSIKTARKVIKEALPDLVILDINQVGS